MSKSPCKIKRALISVSNKEHLIPFAQVLVQLGVDIISTGGTSRTLKENGIPVKDVSDITHFPEIMDGRVKTLHPAVHGGILARRDIDANVMQEHHIEAIDLVIVNLYPFVETVKSGKPFADIIENIDIGGPSLIRGAAKNHAWVTVIVDPSDYTQVLAEFKDNEGSISPDTRYKLATKAFSHTAAYDHEIANTLSKFNPNGTQIQQDFDSHYKPSYRLGSSLRYGENPHQRAAFYLEENNTSKTGYEHPIQGKALSYNNIADADTAIRCVMAFKGPSCCIVKHANPCGVAQRGTLLEAYQAAYVCDPTSAFGGIIAFNQPVDGELCSAILNQQFVEVIIAPSFTQEAKSVCSSKANLRLVEMDASTSPLPALDYKVVHGGLLVQEQDLHHLDISTCKVVTKRQPTQIELADMAFAWQVCHYVKSNAIVFAKQNQTLGIGAGQMSRVFSTKIAHMKAADVNLSLIGASMASDAFFPFQDSIEMAASIGIGCIIQPGGSIRDQEVIDAADRFNMTMIFTGVRHFRH